MSKNKEAQSEERAKIEKNLETALQRVTSLDQQKLIPQLDHLLMLHSQKQLITATQILARKEFTAPSGEEENLSPDDEKTQLSHAIDDRLVALHNHKIVRDALQSLSFSTQMQEAVLDGIKETNVEDTMDHLTNKGVLLAHCGRNFHVSKEFVAVLNEMNELEMSILQLHRKFSSLLKDTKSKWTNLESRGVEVDGENKPLVQLQERTRERESKIQVLVTMIRGLIATSGFQWGAYDYFLQVMQLCDSVTMVHQDIIKQDVIMSEITRIHNDERSQQSTNTLREMLKKK